MAYYNKQEVLEFVQENLKEIEAKGLKPLNPEAEVLKRLDDEEELVGFFWIEYEEGEEDGQKLKFEGKAFYRVDANIYTDDRFAIDLYQAMQHGITVSDVIRSRENEKELAKQGIVDVNRLEEKVKENIKKDGAE